MTAIKAAGAGNSHNPFVRFLNRLTWGDVIVAVILVILLVLVLFPFWWVIRTALTDPTRVYSDPSALMPIGTTTFNLERVLGMIDPSEIVGMQASNLSAGTLNFWIYLRNSVIVSLIITLGQTTFSAMAAYAFARLRFPFRDQIFFLYVTGLMVPGIVLFIPNFVFIRQLDLIGTVPGIVAPFFFMTPFSVFFMRQFFLTLNKDLEESARLDGASVLSIFWRISLPLIQGPLFTMAVLTFIGSWNEYLWPFLVGRNEDVRVLTVALAVFRQQTPQGAPDWAGLMAGTVVAMIPTILVFLFFGRRVVDSIQFSGFK